jgi:hypothetical protein
MVMQQPALLYKSPRKQAVGATQSAGFTVRAMHNVCKVAVCACNLARTGAQCPQSGRLRVEFAIKADV